MKIVCPACAKKARIVQRKTLNKEETIAHLYCQCLNIDCSATFRYCLSFDHYLNDPQRTASQLATELVKRLNAEEKSKLQRDVFI